MKLVTIDFLPESHIGVLAAGDVVLDLTALREILPVATLVPNSMRELLESGVAGMEMVAHCLAQVDSMTDKEKEILTGSGILSAVRCSGSLVCVISAWGTKGDAQRSRL